MERGDTRAVAAALIAAGDLTEAAYGWISWATDPTNDSGYEIPAELKRDLAAAAKRLAYWSDRIGRTTHSEADSFNPGETL